MCGRRTRARAHKFKLELPAVDLRRAIVGIYGYVRSAAEVFCHGLGKLDAGADGDEVDILGVAVEHEVADIPANDEALASETVGSGSYAREYGVGEKMSEIHY